MDENDPLLAEYPEAQFVIRVRATEVFPNCPRYIHEYKLVQRSVRAEGRLRDAGSRLEDARVVARRAAEGRPGVRPLARSDRTRLGSSYADLHSASNLTAQGVQTLKSNPDRLLER